MIQIEVFIIAEKHTSSILSSQTVFSQKKEKHSWETQSNFSIVIIEYLYSKHLIKLLLYKQHDCKQIETKVTQCFLHLRP